MKSDLIDITVQKHRETPKAFLVSDSGDISEAVWVPKSQCEIEPKATVNGQEFFELTLPEWLAKDEGLI